MLCMDGCSLRSMITYETYVLYVIIALMTVFKVFLSVFG